MNDYLRPGWINRAFARVEKDFQTWPKWMKENMKDEMGNKIPLTPLDPNDTPRSQEPTPLDYCSDCGVLIKSHEQHGSVLEPCGVRPTQRSIDGKTEEGK